MSAMLTREEAAARVGKSERTIRNWQRHGLRTMVGMIPEADLLEYDRLMRDRLGRPRKRDPRDVVLADVVAERTRQDAKWGEQNHPDGTGRETIPLARMRSAGRLMGLTRGVAECFAPSVAEVAKEATDRAAAEGRVSWSDILLEEVFEALAEDDPVKLRAELVQVAAVAVQWVEAIDRRAA